MVEDTDPPIVGITGSWGTTDISDAELGMTGYVMLLYIYPSRLMT